MLVLTTSACKTFRSCQRKYMWRYEEGVRRKAKADALTFGTLVHSALEAWWSTCSLDAALEHVNGSPEAYALIAGYHARWIDEPLETLAVEREFSVLVGDPSGHSVGMFELRGKIDAIAKDVDGRVWLVEHKTSSMDISPGSQYWQQLRLDAQVSNYMLGAEAMGYSPVGCLYDVIKKATPKRHVATPVDQRRYTKGGILYANQRDADESEDEYKTRLLASISPGWYQRGTIVRLESEHREAHQDLWSTYLAISACSRHGAWTRNPEACFAYNRACDYWELCTHQACETDLMYERVENVHSELSA